MPFEPSLFYYCKPYRKRFLLAMFFLALVALFTATFAVIIQPLMDELFISGGGTLNTRSNLIRQQLISFLNIPEKKLIFYLPFLLFVTFLGQAIFSFLSLYFMKTMGLKVIRNIRNHLYEHLIMQSSEFIAHSKTGDLISRISNDIDRIKFAISETFAAYIRETLTLIGLIIVIFYQDSRMAAFSLILIPFAGIPLFYFGLKIKKRGLQAQQTIGELSTSLSEAILGNHVVKAYNLEEYEIEKFKKLNQQNYRYNSRIAILYSLAAPLMDIIGGVVAAVLFAYGMSRVSSGQLTPGQFTSFLTALFLMYNPVKRLSQAHNDYQQGKAGFERVKQILEQKNKIQESSAALSLEKIDGVIEFRNVCFAYQPGQLTLKNINLIIAAGENIALVGASGAGKTTLAFLLLRLYDVDSGEILLDGHNIRNLKIKNLRSHIGFVTQDIFLFNDTIWNNLTLGQNYTPEDVWRALTIARAADFIKKLPASLQTIVGERGLLLSTGQRQRLAIARAILKNPPILIFDEATSQLDNESEAMIKEAISEVTKNRTTIFIAHRLSTIVNADRIIVLENGEIRETGTHSELISLGGLYYYLYNLQFPQSKNII